MSELSKIKKGKIHKPIFMVLYGTSGIGKSTFAASAPNPLFITTEEGTNSLDVSRYDAREGWSKVESVLTELASTHTEFGSIVIDSLDHLEPLIFAQVATDHEKANIEDIGYAKGYIYALAYWKKFLGLLNTIRETQGKHIILICHPKVNKFTDPQHNEAYDRYELKLHHKASDLIKETVDMVLFAKKDVAFKKDKNTSKTQAVDMDKHLIYTELDTAYDAKNRFGLPEKMVMLKDNGFQVILDAVQKDDGETCKNLLSQIAKTVKLVKDQEVGKKALQYAEKNEKNINELKRTLNSLEELIKE